MRISIAPVLVLWLLAVIARADPAQIQVFIALADNRTQRIAPVPEKIGNGDDPRSNLYWGCSEAPKPVLSASSDWKLTRSENTPTPQVLERACFAHRSGKWELIAHVYRGAAIRACLTDFFGALSDVQPREKTPLVAYIGHNGLMDFELPAEVTNARGPGRQAIVLCCKSESYFAPHFASSGARPLLLTTQLMYPGGFVLRGALDEWTRGETPEQIRQRAVAAYARNQRAPRGG